MKRKRSIRRKITTLFFATLFVAMSLIGAFSMWNLYAMRNTSAELSNKLGQTAAEDAEEALEIMAQEHLQNITVEKAAYIETKFDEVVSYVHGIAAMAEEIYTHPENYPDREVPLPQQGSEDLAAQLLWSERLLLPSPQQRAELLKLGNIQDLLVQYNAGNDMVSSTYIATRSGWMIQADYIAYSKYTQSDDLPDYYEADTRQWYQRASQAAPGEIVYSDVIADIHEGGDCIVCAQPVYVNDEIVAVAGVGSYLHTVNEAVLNTVIGEHGYAFLVNGNGQIMVSGADSGETAASAEENTDLRQGVNRQLAEAAEDMVSGGSGLCKISVDGREVYLAYAPLEGLGWSFVTVMDVAEVVSPAKESQREILALTETVARQQEASIRRTQVIYIAIVLSAAIVISIISILFAAGLTSPILRLTKEVAGIDGGNLDHKIQIVSGDEVEDLGNAFNDMTAQLRAYIGNLAAVTAERERIRTELGLASQIQADMLPDSTHSFADRKDFVIHAGMTPAKEVGGDFYDFFLAGEDQLVFLAADVSGKGVPASLFMVIAKTLLRSCVSGAKDLDIAVAEVNDKLCVSNKNDMFVTAWVGVLNLTSGILTYVSAGHNYPLLKHGEDGFSYMTERSGFVLAGMEGGKYQKKTVRLHPGDTIFLYTDGVTEANDEKGNLYGEERLERLLNRHVEKEPRQLAEAVWEGLKNFQGKAEQFDDITMLIVRYLGDGWRIKNGTPDMAQIGQINEWVETCLKEVDFSQKTLTRVRLAVDEIYSNICYYSGATEVTVGCKVTGEKEAVLYFEDDGIPYNPLQRPDPDVTKRLEERKEGGLGIYLVKKRMDRVEYQYVEGRNRLTFVKKDV
ncbi:MAG: SpoIIE family protein phosphatase [Candidatus Gastranaerophilales bacterium]|nr:SpoIIE family protein phosphatase [Candidatus Gastranaerophilales bacterium]